MRNNDFKNGELNYVIFQIKDENLEDIPIIMEKAINIVLKNNGNVGHIFSSFVIVFYGILFFDDEDKKLFSYKYKELAKQLLEKLKFNIKVVYGSAQGAVGNIGSEYSQSYGPIIPQLGDIIKTLINCDFGKMIEMK